VTDFRQVLLRLHDRVDRLVGVGGLVDDLGALAALESRSLSEAGRALFAVSRGRRSRANDADRLRKYLARFGLSWRAIQERR
jgi:sigma54-dependent transcription regulator